jgi:hypothetical protein
MDVQIPLLYPDYVLNEAKRNDNMRTETEWESTCGNFLLHPMRIRLCPRKAGSWNIP